MDASSSALVSTGKPRIGKPLFLGIAWGGVAISGLFLIVRLIARATHFKRLYLDDALVTAAWLFTLAVAIDWQVVARYMYQFFAVSAGETLPPPTFFTDTETYLTNSVVAVFFFYTSLWAIKLAFLSFFRRLSQNVSGQRILWWSVAIFTAASYFVCIGTIEYKCLANSMTYIIQHCSTPAAVNFQRVTLKANCALDVVTDYMIMAVPFNMLRKVRLSSRKKGALAAIFSLTVLITVFAIIRVAVVNSSSSQTLDQTWLYMWSFIEQTISIIVCCAASFPSLFHHGSNHSRLQRPTPERSFIASSREKLRRMTGRRHRSESSIILAGMFDSGGQSQPGHEHSSRDKYSTELTNSESWGGTTRSAETR